MTDIPWSPTDYTKADTTIVFDWDDTLLCSSWLKFKNFEPMAMSSKLALTTEAILRKAKTLGRVIIITNASKGWIEMSCSKYMPNVMTVLQGIPLIYAQELYDINGDSPTLWKQKAFLDQMNEAFATSKNIVSIGDGYPEQIALKTIRQLYADIGCTVATKSVKLTERPSPRWLQRQLETMMMALPLVVLDQNNIDLMIDP